MNQIIQVKIIKRKINYIATTALFPNCKGVGKTKSDALKKLSVSISKYISKSIEKTLSSLFLSKSYTQVLLDQTNPTHEETLGFNLSQQSSNLAKSFTLKVSPFNSPNVVNSPLDINGIDNDDDNDDNDDDDDILYDILKLDTSDESSSRNELLDPVTILQQKLGQDTDAIVFGFPLNLN